MDTLVRRWAWFLLLAVGCAQVGAAPPHSARRTHRAGSGVAEPTSPSTITCITGWWRTDKGGSERSGLYQDDGCSTPVTSAGDPIGCMEGDVGAALTQATASLKPTYQTGLLNGRAGIRGDETDDYLFHQYSAGTSSTLVAVFADRTTGADGNVLRSGNLNAPGLYLTTGKLTQNIECDSAESGCTSQGPDYGAQSTSTMEAGVFNWVMVIWDNPDNDSLYFNGSLEDANTDANIQAQSNINFPVLQSHNDTPGVDMTELFRFSCALDADDRTIVDDWIDFRYEI